MHSEMICTTWEKYLYISFSVRVMPNNINNIRSSGTVTNHQVLAKSMFMWLLLCDEYALVAVYKNSL